VGRGLTVASGWHLLGGGVCNFMVRWGGGMDGVHVAGPASLLDVSVDKAVFLCCFDFRM
jgi:hypothetical protein